MRRVFLHKVFAWNFIEDAIECGMVNSPEPGTYWMRKRIEGMQEGAINPQNRRKIREIAVLFDQLLLPGEVDAPVPQELYERSEVTWAGSEFPQARSRYIDPESNPDAILEIRPFIEKAIKARGYQFETNDYERLFTLWSNSRLSRTRSLSLRKQDEIYALGSLVRQEFHFIQEVGYLAQLGVPTFGETPTLSSFGTSRFTGLSSDTAAIVGCYFKNTVRCPSPRNLKEALDLRSHPSIYQWREKVFSWSDKLASGECQWTDIQRDIDEANSYIEGAKFLSRLIPTWSVFVTLPLGLATQLVPPLAPLGWVLIGLDAIAAYGKLIDAAVSSPQRMKYNWIMLSKR